VNKLQSTFLFALCIFFLSSCNNNEPVACFTIGERLETNELYKFNDCSVNAQEYLWDFGDGETSALANPVHAYKDEGTYMVSLTVKNKKKEDELKRTIGTFLNDLTGPSEGIYSGEYLENYPDSTVLNKEYSGAVTIAPTSTKQIKVAFSRGTFRALVVGDKDTGFVFSEVTNLQPSRLELITSGSGSYSQRTRSFNFTLSGRDPQIDSLAWTITYNGTAK
tara:strand:+ start:18873 stop:19535 length:663 start_codon:yes stop_codon:yes gene_type:complete